MNVEETSHPVSFGEWLRRRRKALDLTQAELAQRAGCSAPALRKIEAGERRPSKQLAGLLAKALEIPLENRANFIRVARGELNPERLRPLGSFPLIEVPAFQGPSIARNNIPVQPSRLVGREAELAALEKLLADPHCRLLTITGMGGIGKTRLAIELASQKQASYPGGVYFVPLASLDSAGFIVPAIADALGIPLSGTIDPREQLLSLLSARARQPMLLVLDNLEHLLVPSVQEDGKEDPTLLLADMLQRTPDLQILATSRERICIQGEWTFELYGLTFPARDQSDHLEIYSATALFIQRARQVKTDFEVRPEERPALARICQLLEGTPLAIELAAAWVRVLSIDAIAGEIASNLDFLTHSMRDVSERHRSLRATFEHSWKLLTAEEQQGLCRLAVFRGGFQREAAEQVAGASLPILMSLFSKSLILRKENGRFDLHEVVRQYALAHLAEGSQEEETRERHCKYYLELVRGEEQGFSEADQWLGDQTLEDELDNLRAAMTWGLWNYQIQWTLQIATALGQFWYTHGYWREGLTWLDWGLNGPGPVPDLVRAKALTVAGRLARYLGDYSQATDMLRESLDLWRESGEQTGIAQTLCNLGAVVFRQGDRESAMDLFDEALSEAIRQGDRRGRYCTLENLGHAASRKGDSQSAIELYQESLALAQEAGDEHQVANLLNAMGDEYLIAGDYDRAEDYFSQGAQISQRLGNRLIGAYISANRGMIAIKQGRYSQAFDLLAGAILVLGEIGAKEEVVLCFEPMAYMALEQGCPERAASLLGASESQLHLLSTSRSQALQADYEAWLSAVRSQLVEAAFEEAWAGGCQMTYEEAIAYATDLSWLKSS